LRTILEQAWDTSLKNHLLFSDGPVAVIIATDKIVRQAEQIDKMEHSGH
jgi:hypothetical protein